MRVYHSVVSASVAAVALVLTGIGVAVAQSAVTSSPPSPAVSASVSPGPAATGGASASASAVPPGAVAASPSNHDWPMYNNEYDGERWTSENQINTGNAAKLHPVCHRQLASSGQYEPGPVVIGHVMYLTAQDETYALDATTCKSMWKQSYKLTSQSENDVNRGVAYTNGVIYRGEADGHLLAIDAKNGHVKWNVSVADTKKSEFLSAAPIVWNGMVYIGIAGADWGARGRMLAFDASDGRKAWTFELIPTGNQAGANTWPSTNVADHGGGSTWSSFTLDVHDGSLYIPVGNPAPDFAPEYRKGKNLYTDSLVVLDAKTGKLKWYHQFIANDAHDWDIAAPPALITTKGGKHLVVVTSKDSMVYALDHNSHQMVWQTVVSPRKNVNANATKSGVRVCPGWIGGVEWNGAAFDPDTNDVYANSVLFCGTYLRGNVRYSAGNFYLGGGIRMDDPSKAHGYVNALDADTGKIVWRHKLTPMVAALTPTAGGLVFTGDMNGNFLVYNAKNGKELYRNKTSGAAAGGVATYLVNGKQYVAIPVGNTSRSNFHTTGSPSIYIYALK